LYVARAHRYNLHTNDTRLLYPNLRNIDVLKKTISFSLKREDINVRKIEKLSNVAQDGVIHRSKRSNSRTGDIIFARMIDLYENS